MTRFLTILLLIMAGCASATATEFWIAQNATGNGSGADTNDCMALGWPSANPGDTVHLVGTFTNYLTVGSSGSAGNPITILFEPNAKFSAPVINGAIVLYEKDYITIDGGSNGLIESTDNGSSLGNQTNSVGIGATSCSYLTVKNLTIRNLYVRTSNSDDKSGNGAGGWAIIDSTTTGSGHITEFTVSNCVMSDCYVGINADYGNNCSNYIFVANTMYRCNWGGKCSDNGSGAVMHNLVVQGNHIYDFTNWNDTVSDNYHHNGFYEWAKSGGTCDGVTYNGNLIGPDFGGPYCTSGMWADGVTTNILMCNNVIICNTNEAPANAMLQGEPGRYFNNTFIGGGTGQAITTGDSAVTNGINTWVMGNLTVSAAAFMNNYGINCSYVLIDSNLVYNLPPGAQYSFGGGGSSWFRTFSEAQAIGFELHSLDENPLVNLDGTLQAGSPAIGAGPNFTSLGITNDFAGNPRPATGPWTIGAYQSGTNAPAPPTGHPGGFWPGLY